MILINMKSLHDYFIQLEDPRRDQGKRYSLSSYLSMLTLSYMSGHYSMQSVHRFFINNEEDLVDIFELKHGVPSYAGIRDFMQKLDFDQIKEAFRSWALQFLSKENMECVSIDGKCLGSTVINCHSREQSYVSIVSAFVGDKGINISYSHMDNGKASECNQVRELLKELKELGCLITLDALHCKKNDRPDC